MANTGIHPDSDLWLDQPNGIERIRQQMERGLLDAQEAQGLRQFFESGYVRFRLADAEASFDDLLADVDRLWRTRPA
ncbi:MAG: hypothetical protein WAO20_21345, partial [Acidobacteriota bacterium]